jgi:hypothetical protein
MALQSLILPIISLFRSAGINQAANALRGLGGQFNSLAGQIGTAAASFSAFQALTTAQTFTKDSVAAANLFERNLLGLNQVFEQLQPRIVAFTKEVENYGLSQSQAAQASVFLGSVLKQYGFNTMQVADETERLVTLSQDLATTYGYDVSEALLAVTALFRGEYDPIEKFGVAMKQNEVNARLAAQGLGDLEGAALANAQATARLEMLFERAGDSIGAFGRASDTLYGSQQRLNAVMSNLQLAFGAPLQRPLAAINNLFADLAQEFGPDIVQIGDALASTVGSLTPIIGLLTRTFFELISPLQQIIEIINLVITILTGALSPAIATINGLLGIFNGLLDVGSALLGQFAIALGGAAGESDNFKRLLENMGIDPDRENTLERLVKMFNTWAAAINRWSGSPEVFSSNLHLMELGLIASATQTANLANKVNVLDKALRDGAIGAVNAEGKLSGLAGVFERIDEAIAKSKAKQSMEELGLSAAFIEEVLTRPNWQEIFKKIAYFAKITASEVQKVFVPGVGTIETGNTEANRKRIANEINELFAASDPKTAGTKTGKSFFEGLNEEVAKQAAASKLRSMKATEGLIQAILGTDKWEETYKRIIAMGPSGLRKLQEQFNKTAAGIQEAAEAAKEFADANKAARDAALEAIEANVKSLKNAAKEAADALTDVKARAEEFRRWSLDNLTNIRILPDFERELGRFEEAIVSTISGIQSELTSAVRSGLITDASFRSLSAWVNTESKALQEIAKRRDDLANRAALSESLIKEYQGALTSALKLTSLFSRLKNETEKVTITEVSEGVIKLGSTLKEFGVTVTRTYEKTIEQTTSKSAALVEEFKTMTQKARDFAANLVKLRDMGLDPMLFSDLVQAGVEAGGETAQALVEGGSETIGEINSLFSEINKLGAELGLDVGQTMYDAGRDMTFGLIDGIRSEQQQLYDQAIEMAKTFSETFKNSLNIAIDIPIRAAEQVLKEAESAVTKAQTADIASVMQIQKLIDGATAAMDVVKGEAARIGILFKRNVFEAIKTDLLSGMRFDLGGIVSGLSSAELIPRAGALGSGAVQNYFELVVNAGLGADGTQIGQQIVNEILKYERSSGTVFARSGS